MLDFLTGSTVQAILSVVALAAICTVAYFIVLKLRDSSLNDQRLDDEALKNLEEMRQQGDISDAEYRKIQSVLGMKQASDADDAKQAS
ncbi:MAG: hypothetical protein U0905_06570 [Pirellulales bacterium]